MVPCCWCCRGGLVLVGVSHGSHWQLHTDNIFPLRCCTSCRPDVWQQVSIPLQSLLMTYQGQLVQRKLEFQANQVISVGVAASAMPAAEADMPAVSMDTPSDASSSSSHSSSSGWSESGTASSSSASSQSADGMQDAGDSSSSNELGDAEVTQLDSSSWPEHERFRLLVRSIRAEVEL